MYFFKDIYFFKYLVVNVKTQIILSELICSPSQQKLDSPRNANVQQ